MLLKWARLPNHSFEHCLMARQRGLIPIACEPDLTDKALAYEAVINVGTISAPLRPMCTKQIKLGAAMCLVRTTRSVLLVRSNELISMMNTMDTKRTLGLAVAQMGAINLSDSRASAVGRMVEMMRDAKGRGADVVIFPELALTTFFPRYWMDESEATGKFFEQTMPNVDVQPLFDTARDLSVGFYLGYAELTPNGRRFNTSILVDRTGSIIGKYRKIHLPGHSDHKKDVPFQHLEKKYFEVGNLGFPVFDTMGAKFGMCICNDRRWPETYRVMALQSAEIVVLGYNTPSINIHWNEPVHLRTTTHLLVLRANAYQNGMWVAAAAKCGSEDGHHMIGSSAIVAPTGEIVAQTLTEEDEVICTKADLSIGDIFRGHVFNFAKHRRPEYYKLIVERTGAGDPLPYDPE